MQLQHNISLKAYNTFGIDVPAAHFTELETLDDLEAISRLPYARIVLGGGSNVLLKGPLDALVIHNVVKGIAVIKEDAAHVWLRVAAGEVWHDLVLYAIERGWGGIENLALIPGTVGASPMQNIGAYGVEARETIQEVTCWHWKEQQYEVYSNEACQFGYRDSIFKRTLKDKVFITSVVYRLNKQPVYNTSYGAIEQELVVMGVSTPSVRAIAQAVMNIRRSKLPDPAVIGNAGSFFKNPTIARSAYERLRVQYADMPSYTVSDTLVKVPAGWLIEHCGWKGYRRGDMGVHARQALVLVNYGHASGSELWELSGEIVASVKERFGIELEREVQILG
jgi:UDP-N-acetylmuramate dehydrogenase